ncbi:MAG: Asp-tRNA(Asn)/Glu-tRNA(Gln) amidotransferase subunit GatC [Candidatus Veblenbacteria bacterium]|nr:Asp-tRNA(Asn)/Glu-tRNA(Gln) amidotransferase subunit GatC [Candidatus Veblenbacteria bacterium]MDZ4230085.1 Asp-tRNA(Asn)/Glu-tRNA(Gln) amidotransferase subunit GatC [Candidatus Veblenbacteria bacterium]
MGLTAQEVEHLARLARLELTPAEVEKFSQQLAGVLDYVAKLQSLTSEGGASLETLAVEWRVDEVRSWPEAAELIKEAPVHTGTHIEVPEVFGERQ